MVAVSTQPLSHERRKPRSAPFGVVALMASMLFTRPCCHLFVLLAYQSLRYEITNRPAFVLWWGFVRAKIRIISKDIHYTHIDSTQKAVGFLPPVSSTDSEPLAVCLFTQLCSICFCYKAASRF